MEPLTTEMIENIYANVLKKGLALTMYKDMFFLTGAHRWASYRQGKKLMWSLYE